MTQTYRMCTRCVMDTSDAEIEFREDGVCSHCVTYEHRKAIFLPSGPAEAEDRLRAIVAEMKEAGRGREYDCLLGVSGGVDSSYLAHLAVELGLRPLAVHIDSGWDSELAVKNIEMLMTRLGLDLHTHVIDWQEIRDLQVAYLKASVINADIPFDHAIPAVLHRIAAQYGIRHILSGQNFITESVMPVSWIYYSKDLRNLKAINKRFGSRRLKRYPTYSLWDQFRYKVLKRIKTVHLLNYIDYVKQDALDLLEKKYDWRNYGGKHYESVYTRFFQGYILPTKFGVDKRRPHLSTLILSGQLDREDALRQLERDPYNDDEQTLAEDLEYFPKKLGLSQAEFAEIMALPVRSHFDYPNNHSIFMRLRDLRDRIRPGFGRD